MTEKIKFFYCVGTSYTLNWMLLGLNQPLITPAPSKNVSVVAGLNGKTAIWDGGPPADPFPSFLNPEIWEAEKIDYAPAIIGMDTSMADGAAKMIAKINALPRGQRFAIGGYSQGAATISTVYSELRSGTLTSRYADFLGGVCFGNPRRQVNYRGAVGGTWSGAFDVSGSTTGGHGSFPTTGGFPRLTSCNPDNWLEFAAPDDIFTSVGDSTLGLNWTQGNDICANLTTSAGSFIAALFNVAGVLGAVQQAVNLAGIAQTMTDGAGTVFNWLGGNGHVTYPFMPPPGNPDGTLTAYQIALKWLESKAAVYSTAPIIIPSSSSTAGWSTTLVAPAA